MNCKCHSMKRLTEGQYQFVWRQINMTDFPLSFIEEDCRLIYCCFIAFCHWFLVTRCSNLLLSSCRAWTRSQPRTCSLCKLVGHHGPVLFIHHWCQAYSRRHPRHSTTLWRWAVSVFTSDAKRDIIAEKDSALLMDSKIGLLDRVEKLWKELDAGISYRKVYAVAAIPSSFWIYCLASITSLPGSWLTGPLLFSQQVWPSLYVIESLLTHMICNQQAGQFSCIYFAPSQLRL